MNARCCGDVAALHTHHSVWVNRKNLQGLFLTAAICSQGRMRRVDGGHGFGRFHTGRSRLGGFSIRGLEWA